MKIRWLLLLALFLIPLRAQAQGVRVGDNPQVTTAPFPGGPLTAVANAGVSFCAHPANQVPCTNKVTTYTDITLTTACPNGTQIVLAGTSNCVATSDGLGNWGVNVPLGVYDYTIQLPTGGSVGPFTVTISGAGVLLGTNNTWTGTNNFVGGITINGLPAVNVQGPITPGHCASWLTAATLQDAGVCSGGGGAGTVLNGNQYSMTDYPNSGSSATVGPINIHTDASGNNSYTPGSSFTTQNPLADITMQGGRAVSSIPQTTISCTATLNTATVASSTGFQIGDGIAAYGCGATSTLTTPSAPAIANVVDAGNMNTGKTSPGAAGATTATYCAVARGKNGDQTPCSPAGTTTTGQATLGSQTFSNSSLVRSGTTVTVTTSGAHNLLVGCSGAGNCGWVHEFGPSDASFTGNFLVTSVADSTHFTYSQGMDTNAGATLSATGGTTQTWASNKVTITPVTGAWQYYICKNGASTPIGITKPGELTFYDYGVAAPTLPDFASCSLGANSVAYLSTTITNISGLNWTFANNAGNSTTSSEVKFDDGPAYSATAAVAGTVHFPATSATTFYPFESHVISPFNETVIQSACVQLDETMEWGPGTTWSGDLGGSCPQTTQFGQNVGEALNIKAAYPGVYMGQSGSGFRRLSVNVNNNGLGFAVAINGGSSQFNPWWENNNFVVGAQLNGGDYLGGAIWCYACANVHSKDNLFLASGPSSGSLSTTPTVFLRNDIGNANPSNKYISNHDYFNQRSFAIDATGFGPPTVVFEEPYEQSAQVPTVGCVNLGGCNIYYRANTQDTSPAAYVYYGGTNFCCYVEMHGVGLNSIDVNNNQNTGIVTGNLIYSLLIDNGPSIVGQNRNLVENVNSALVNIPVYSPNAAVGMGVYAMDEVMHSSAGNPWVFDLPPPTAFNATLSAGGSVPVGAHIYYVAGEDANGAISNAFLTPFPITVTGGNQTVNLSWTGSQGSVAFKVYRDGNGVNLCKNITVTTCVDSFSFTNGEAAPNTTAAGNSGISPGLLWANKLIITSPLSGGVSFAASIVGSNTAPVTLTLPPSSGTLCTVATCPGTGNVTGSGLTVGQIVLGGGGTAVAVGNLSGDCSTSGSAAVTCTKINGGVFPTSAGVVGSNGSAQPITANAHGIGNALRCSDTSGSATTQSCFTSPTYTPAPGDWLIYTTTTPNSGTLTLALNGGSASHVKKWQGSSDLAAGDMPSGQYVLLFFDSSNQWEAQNIGNAPSGGGSGNCPLGATDSIQYNAGGGVCAGIPSPIINSTYGIVFQVTASGAVIPTAALPGVPVDAEASTTPSVIGASSGSSTPATDRVSMLQTINNSVATTLTVPQPGSSGFTSNFSFVHCNTGSVVATDATASSTVNGNASLKLLGFSAGNNPECAFYWSDNSNWWSAEILPTDSNGRLHATGFPALTGDCTTAAGTVAVTCTKINNVAFAGTTNDVVAFGAGNTPIDTSILYTNLTTQASNGAANQVCTYTGANKVCVPGSVTNAMLASPPITNVTTTVGVTPITANTCTAVTTMTMTGLASTMTFSFTPNADVSGVIGWGATGGLVIDAWPTTNTLNYKVCNQTASPITPGSSVTFNVSAR